MGCKFRRQQFIGGYIADFACMEKRLIIEVDGGQHSDQVERDDARTEFLEREGYRVIRFWNHDVLQRTDAVLEQIVIALEEEVGA